MKYLWLLGVIPLMGSCSGATPANSIRPSSGKYVTSSGESTRQTSSSTGANSTSTSSAGTSSTSTAQTSSSSQSSDATSKSTSSSTTAANSVPATGPKSSTSNPIVDMMSFTEAKGKCASCHGANGSGSKKWNKADGSEADWKIFAQIALNSVTKGSMPPEPLTETDKQRLQNYLISILPP